MSEIDARPTPLLTRIAQAVVLLTFLMCVAFVLVVATEARQDLSIDQVLVFLILPSVAALSLGGVLRSSPQTSVKVALLLMAIGASVLIAESALIVLIAVHDGRVGAAPPAWDDTRPMFQRLVELRTAGEQAYPTVPGNILVGQDLTFPTDSGPIHPLAPALGDHTAVLCAEGGTPVTYAADRFGFNNPDDVWELATVDVALVGDSYTQGVCVEEPHQVASLLRDHWTVLNLGARGAGPFQELAILREYGAPKQPSVTAWIYYEGNDLSDMGQESSSTWLRQYLDPDHRQELISKQGFIAAGFRPWLDSLVEKQSFASDAARPRLGDRLRNVYRLVHLRRLVGFGVLSPWYEPDLETLIEVLERARRDTASWGGRFMVVYVPAHRRYTTRLGETFAGRVGIREYAEENDIPFVDLDSAFKSVADPLSLWLVPGGHLDRDGYAIAARTLRDAIEARPVN